MWKGIQHVIESNPIKAQNNTFFDPYFECLFFVIMRYEKKREKTFIVKTHTFEFRFISLFSIKSTQSIILFQNFSQRNIEFFE
jgi:hypothetical protein